MSEEIKRQWQEGILTLYLKGRVDSNNAGTLEQEINQIISEEPVKDITIDADGLNYISSAGLRILLHLRKKFTGLRIKNVSSEVYEILDVTGFTKMIDVEKAYRRVSIEGCEIIGEGSNGTLYRIDDDTVVKVYNNPEALDDIRHERELAQAALLLGIPTAISYDVVKVGDRYGSVFELLNARSFAAILRTQPEMMDWCVQEYTEMLHRIHRTVVPEGMLPDIRETVIGWVEFMKDYLPASSYEKLRRMVDEVPKDQHMIHGDYHIKNLELQGDEVLLIDMDTLSVGHPIFELGSMYNAYLGFSEMDHDHVEGFLGINYETSRTFWNKVLSCYLATEDPDIIRAVEDKARIIGYVRLIRRSIRRQGLEHEESRAEIELWKKLLLELLDRVDTLLFDRNEIVLAAKEDQLYELQAFIEEHLQNVQCPAALQMQINMAVEEIFVNIALYAYPDREGEVLVRVGETFHPGAISITFIDQGIPFNPLEREEPDVNLPAQEREIGGLGIFLVKKTMDEVAYQRIGENNVFTMKKTVS